MKSQLNWSMYLRDIRNWKLLFFGPYLRRSVGKIVGINSLWRQCWSSEKKREIQNRVFGVDLAQKWFVRPLTWKEQAICLQKLQAVVITFLLLNFLEEYIIVKRPLTTFTNFLELYWKCAYVSPIFFKMHSQNVFI